MKKQSNKPVEKMAETAHGLGINCSVPRAVVENLEWHIWIAANISAGLGMDWDHFNDLCDAAFDVAPGLHPRLTK